MAQEKVTYVKLYAPDGTHVEVKGEGRAKVLKEQRGYTTSKPRNPTKPVNDPRYAADPAVDTRVAELEAELKAAQEELAKAQQPAESKK